jgi:hypothetical protein
MKFLKIKTSIYTLFLLFFLTLESFASPLSLTLTYNNATNTVTANWRLPFPRAITTYTWTDQSGVQVGSGTTPLNSTSILVPYNAASLTCEISIQDGDVLLTDESTIDFDIIIDDDLVFAVQPNGNGNPDCSDIASYSLQWDIATFQTLPDIGYYNQSNYYYNGEVFRRYVNLSGSQEYLGIAANKIINQRFIDYADSINNSPGTTYDICDLFSNMPILLNELHSFNGHRVKSIEKRKPRKAKRLKSDEQYIKVLSNPFEGELNFRIEYLRDEHGTMRIIDALGRTVLQQNNIALDGSSNYLSITTEDLDSGIYFYQFEINGEIYAQGKVVKQQ